MEQGPNLEINGSKGICLAFQPMGGMWERMMRTIQRVLNALIREQVLQEDSLANFVCSAEAIVNNRPLTTVSVDHKKRPGTNDAQSSYFA